MLRLVVLARVWLARAADDGVLCVCACQFNHVKRIRKNKVAASAGAPARVTLTVLLCEVDRFASLPDSVVAQLDELPLGPRHVVQVSARDGGGLQRRSRTHAVPTHPRARVAQVPATCGDSREDALKLSATWPVVFRAMPDAPAPPTSDEVGCMVAHMAAALRLAQAAEVAGRVPVGAVLVDAASNCVVATAQDCRPAGAASTPAAVGAGVCASAAAAAGGGGGGGGSPAIGGTSARLAHATMECIHAAAAVVRRWKVAPAGRAPGAGSSAAAASACVTPQKRKRAHDETEVGTLPPNPSQYLCSGFDLYVTREPCPM